jgi:hypothetical protein
MRTDVKRTLRTIEVGKDRFFVHYVSAAYRPAAAATAAATTTTTTYLLTP